MNVVQEMHRARVLAIDWSILIHELRFTHGMTMLDIAREVQLNRDTILSYYSRIARPKHHDGEALIALWMRITCKPREQLAREPMPLSAARMRNM